MTHAIGAYPPPHQAIDGGVYVESENGFGHDEAVRAPYIPNESRV